MGKYRVGIVFLLAVAAFLAGCFGGSENALSVVPVAAPITTQTTSVRFEIAAPAMAGNLRAETGVVPQVFFELRLLDRNSSTMPVIRMVRQGQAVAESTGYTATARFENVPVLPAVASMSITGGYLAGAGGQNYKIWVGKKDLVAASENTVTLVGSGDKSATDVAVNLLDRLIAAPANVATLALPIFEKVDGIVAGLDLNSSTVYEQALLAYNAAYAPTPVPADAEFMPPSDYASLAYPKKDSSVSLTIPAFAAASEAWVLLINRSASTLTPSWSVSKTVSGSQMAAIISHNHVTNSHSEVFLTSAEQFHRDLRRHGGFSGLRTADTSLVRPSLRSAVSVGSLETFEHITNSSLMTFETITAHCKAVHLHANGRASYIFLDDANSSILNVDAVIAGLSAKWAESGKIHDTDRRVFGNDPEGIFLADNTNYDAAASATYILVSSKIYTAGYFYAGDLYVQDHSNRKKIFFLQLPADLSTTNAYKLAIDMLAATAAHEFQHMIHFWQKRSLTLQQYDANAWLDEAMSGYAEHINGFSVAAFNNRSKALDVNNYFAVANRTPVNQWFGNSADYGKAYLFGIWLAQNFGTNDSVSSGLIANNNYADEAIRNFTGKSVDEVYARFLLALAVNNYQDGGLYGIRALNLATDYAYLYGLANVKLTGPALNPINISLANGTGKPEISAYAAAFIKITNGNGDNVSITATLPTGISLFQLQK